MFRIFAKLRNHLLGRHSLSDEDPYDKSFGKYLIYGVGEVLLIVIGILIALQINNRNEYRKERKIELKILKELRSDLSQNRSELDTIYERIKVRLEAVDSCLSFLNNHLPFDPKFQQHLNLAIARIGIFNNANTSYQYIASRGVNLISNDSLRLQISWLYEREFNNAAVRSSGYSTRRSRVTDYLDRYFEKNLIMDVPTQEMTQYKIHPHGYLAFQGDLQFKNDLISLKQNFSLREHFLAITFTEIKYVADLIDKEIGRLE